MQQNLIYFFKEKSSGFPPEIIEIPVLLVDLVTGDTGEYFGFLCFFSRVAQKINKEKMFK